MEEFFQDRTNGELFVPNSPSDSSVSCANITDCSLSHARKVSRVLQYFVEYICGHALAMFYNYSVIDAINECKRMSSQYAAYACATGTYMEYLFVHAPANGKLPESPSTAYPCDVVNEYPTACYRYLMQSPAFARLPCLKAANYCLNMFRIEQRHGCLYGYGYQHATLAIVSSSGNIPLESLCNVGDMTRSETQLCIEGAAGWFDEHNRTAKHLVCGSLMDFSFQQHCFQMTNGGYRRSPELYYAMSEIAFSPSNLQELMSRFPKQIPAIYLGGNYEAIGLDRLLAALSAVPPLISQGITVYWPCNLQGHAVGMMVYQRTNRNLTAAAVICGRKCSEFCLHGALIADYNLKLPELISYSTNQNNSAFVERIRLSYEHLCNSDDCILLNILGSLECYHTLGHAVMIAIANYSFSNAVAECRDMGEEFKVYSCASGVYFIAILQPELVVYSELARLGQSVILPKLPIRMHYFLAM